MKQVIEFGPKFCQAQLSDILTENDISAYHRSFLPEIDEVHFDLSLTEWVSTEEIVFLFSWIRNIKNLKKIKVWLPFRYPLSRLITSGKLSKSRYQQFIAKYEQHTHVVFKDDETTIARRQRSSAFLMAAYGLYDRIGLAESDFENLVDYNTYNKEVTRLRENNHQIIPFTFFVLEEHTQHIKFDVHYNNVINNNLSAQHRTHKIFDLQNDLFRLLRKYACYSPFESKILSNIITQELYINSLQHSFEEAGAIEVLPECYITAFLANKWEYPESEKFNPSFLEEKYKETLDFYKDKEAITKRINTTLKKKAGEPLTSRPAELTEFKKHFKNVSYLEYTFMDLGAGIYQTLAHQLDGAIESKETGELPLSAGFNKAHRDSQVLEYAFLMDTSRYPLDKTINDYELVPRGLYFLVDMVRRYKGLLIARSGYGQIVYDFSDKIDIVAHNIQPYAQLRPVLNIADSIIHQRPEDATFFPGTMLSIVLPEKPDKYNQEAKDLKKKVKDKTVLPPVRSQSAILASYAYSLTDRLFRNSEHPLEKFSAHQFEYISILFLYNKIIEDFKREGREVHIKDIYNHLFDGINRVLNQHKSCNSILFFDFSGLKSGNTTWIKILYFLVNSPRVNELTKVVIVNLPGDETAMLSELKANLRGTDERGNKKNDVVPGPFLYRPIPCIRFIADAKNESDQLQWIGLKEPEDEVLLTSLLLGNARDNEYPEGYFEHPENIEGSFFVLEDAKVHATFVGFELLKETFKEKQREVITAFLKEHIEKGNRGKASDSAIFLASNGGFQYNYLSLYETLHDQYMARYFAKTLLDDYCEFIRGQLVIDLAEESPAIDFTFTKIVVVTVSSQLLGVAIRELLKEDSNYAMLMKTNMHLEPVLPELIILSSYYSFDEEKPFERITPGDGVLIVNDVISTGNLVRRLWDRIEDDNKEAIVNAVFTIADTRTPKKRHRRRAKQKYPELFSEKFAEGREQFIFSLSSFKDGLFIRKYRGPYVGDAMQKRINPLLNTVVELTAANGEQNKILYSETIDFLADAEIDPDYLNIGHFQQNQTHNGYLTDLSHIFSGEAGLTVIQKIKDRLDKKKANVSCINEQEHVAWRLDHLKTNLAELTSHKSDPLVSEVKENIHRELERLQILLTEDRLEAPVSYKPDFIFYPVFSSIEKLDIIRLSEIFSTHPDNVIGLQRFDTPKGWRFPFPAKRLNLLTKNKSVLILDSGSLTGESLVQMIDNVCFLDVKNIVVLTIITRIEDFYREFYSRSKAINVRRVDEQLLSATAFRDKVIPIDVFFGINLHAPVYSAITTCPFCKEINYLTNIAEVHQPILPARVKDYLRNRLKELEIQVSPKKSLVNAVYLPVGRENGAIDSTYLFHMRDLIGKIDSYRFYPDYFEDFNRLQKRISSRKDWYKDKEILRDVELLMICLVHEPHLAELIKNYINGIYNAITDLLQMVVDSNFDLELFYYRWKLYAVIRLCQLLIKPALLEIKTFEKILCLDDITTECFLQFKFWEMLYMPGQTLADRTNVYFLLKTFNDNYSQTQPPSAIYNKKNREFTKLLYKEMPLQSLPTFQPLSKHFENLSHFVYKNENKGTHFELTYRLNQLFLAINSPSRSIEKILEEFEQVNHIFDRYLKPSLVTITKNQMIKESVDVIYDICSPKPDGLLYYIVELEKLYQELLPVKQEDIDDYNGQLATISSIYDKLINKVLRLDEQKQCFYKICKQYPCNLKTALKELMTRYESQDIIKPINFGTHNDASYQIAFHKHILDKLLEEVMSNAIENYKKTTEILQITMRIRIMNENSLLLEISQNNPFKKPDGEGGRTNFIQYFVQELEGIFEDNSAASMENGSDYWMRLEFTRYQYKQPKDQKIEDEVIF